MTPKFLRRTVQLAQAGLLFPSTAQLANTVISYLVQGCVISGARQPSLRPRQPAVAGRPSVLTATLNRHKPLKPPIQRLPLALTLGLKIVAR